MADDIKDITDLTKDMTEAFSRAGAAGGNFESILKKLQKQAESTNVSVGDISKTASKIKPLNIFTDSSASILKGVTGDVKKMAEELHYMKEASAAAGVDALMQTKLQEEILSYKTKMVKMGLTQQQISEIENGVDKDKINANKILESLTSKIASNKASAAAEAAKETGIIGKLIGFLDSIIPIFGKIRQAISLLGAGWGIALVLITEAFRRFYSLESAAKEFRVTTGLISTQMEQISNSARQINVELAHFGVSIKEVYVAAASLYSSFQTSHLITHQMMKDSAKIAENIGVSVSSFAKLSSLFSNISNTSGEVSTNVIHASIALSNLAGVAPSVVMKDLEESSENMLKFLAKAPMQMMRSAVEARRMGTTIKSISESARGMLNYQESMTAELEASALLNKNISFQRVRQLAWEGKIIESREEALRQIQMTGNFTRMNIFQQEALAKAAGMTVEEIIKQQNQEKALNALKASGSVEDKQRISAYEKMRKEIRSNNELDAISTGRHLADQQLRQHEIEKIVNEIKGAWTEVTDAMIPIVKSLMPSIKDGVAILRDTLKTVAESFKTMMPVVLVGVKAIAVVIGWIFSLLSGIISPVSDLIGFMNKLSDSVKDNQSLFGSLGSNVANTSNAVATASRNVAKASSESASSVQQSSRNLTKSTTESASAVARSSNDVAKASKRSAEETQKSATSMIASNAKVATSFAGLTIAAKNAEKAVGDGAESSKESTFSVMGFIASVYTGLARMKPWSSIVKWISHGVSALAGIINSALAGIINSFISFYEYGSRSILIKIKKTGDVTKTLLSPISWMLKKFISIGDAIDSWYSKGGKFAKFIIGIQSGINKIIVGAEWVSKTVGKLYGYFSTAYNWISKIASSASKFSWIAKIGLGFAKFIPILGWIITGAEFLYSLYTRFSELFKSEEWANGGIGKRIFLGIKAVGGAIFDVLVSPFRAAIKAVSGWLGMSPSEIGLGIVNGIKSVGSMLFGFLVSPFQRAWEKIKELPFINKLFGSPKDVTIDVSEKVRTNLENASEIILEVKNLDILKETVQKLTDAVIKLSEVQSQNGPIHSIEGKDNSENIVLKLEELIQLISSGLKIDADFKTLTSRAR